MKTTQNLSDEPAVIPLGEQGQIKVSNVIHGFLPFNKDSNVAVKNVNIFLEGIDQAFAEVDPIRSDNGASFEHVLEAKARAGIYRVEWNTLIHGKESKIINTFKLSDDIDRTIPIELQHLA